MKTKKSIAFLICYMGKLPWYFDYFAHSCKFNPDIDFYVITDDVTYKNSLPENLKLQIMTLNEVSALASKKLGLNISIKQGYKLCDFKPAYGKIFMDLVKGYDFWGHCDIDLIFGNIRDFMTDDLLEDYELISVRHDWLSGCFLLYKNIEKINTLYLNSKHYKKVFTSDTHYCFDETNFAHQEFTDERPYHEISTEIESMTHVVKKMEERGSLKPFFDFFIIEGLPGKLKWINGKMFYRNQYEILFYHLIHFKNIYKPNRIPKFIPKSFSISPTKIYHN